jgi:hypothetical protein
MACLSLCPAACLSACHPVCLFFLSLTVYSPSYPCTPVSRLVYAGYSCEQLGLCRILRSSVGFMQDTSVSRWVYAGYSLLLPAGGLMQYAPVCGWVYAGYSCQPMANAGYSWQQMDLCRILLSADEFMHSCQRLG